MFESRFNASHSKISRQHLIVKAFHDPYTGARSSMWVRPIALPPHGEEKGGTVGRARRRQEATRSATKSAFYTCTDSLP